MGFRTLNKANGIHTSEVVPYYEAKSISTENTFEENIRDADQLLIELVGMTERVDMNCGRKIKWPDV
jgi:DNA polymerase-4